MQKCAYAHTKLVKSRVRLEKPQGQIDRKIISALPRLGQQLDLHILGEIRSNDDTFAKHVDTQTTHVSPRGQTAVGAWTESIIAQYDPPPIIEC